MARTHTPLLNVGRCGVIEQVTETYTHRQAVEGGVIYGDPARRFWRRANGVSGYGEPPPGWDAARAELLATPLVHSYLFEADYS